MYSYEFGRGYSRLQEPKNIKPDKDHIGDQITLFTDRCVMCTCCVRFTREISGTGELQVINRADREEIDTARKAGEAKLAALRGGADAAALPAATLFSRASAQAQPRALVDAVLRADASKLPQWLGVDLGEAGYAVVRLTAIKPLAADAPELAQLLPRYAQAWGAAKICRKIVKDVLLLPTDKKINVTSKNLDKYLGVKRFRYGMVEERAIRLAR